MEHFLQAHLCTMLHHKMQVVKHSVRVYSKCHYLWCDANITPRDTLLWYLRNWFDAVVVSGRCCSAQQKLFVKWSPCNIVHVLWKNCIGLYTFCCGPVRALSTTVSALEISFSSFTCSNDTASNCIKSFYTYQMFQSCIYARLLIPDVASWAVLQKERNYCTESISLK